MEALIYYLALWALSALLLHLLIRSDRARSIDRHQLAEQLLFVSFLVSALLLLVYLAGRLFAQPIGPLT